MGVIRSALGFAVALVCFFWLCLALVLGFGVIAFSRGASRLMPVFVKARFERVLNNVGLIDGAL